MTCVREPACRCCQAGKPCAFVLQLDQTQQNQLRRVLELVGDNPARGPRTRGKSQPIASHGVGPIEPTTVFECDDCGSNREMMTYLHEFLRTNHIRLPACIVCEAARRAA